MKNVREFIKRHNLGQYNCTFIGSVDNGTHHEIKRGNLVYKIITLSKNPCFKDCKISRLIRHGDVEVIKIDKTFNGTIVEVCMGISRPKSNLLKKQNK